MNKVFRCFSEKKPGFDVEARALSHDLRHQLGISSLTGVRIINRYDIQGLDEEGYAAARDVVFSEPQCDLCSDETAPAESAPHRVLAVEALPGQYDQRADSCAQCVALLRGGERPLVRAATLYYLLGNLSDEDERRIAEYIINPVERRRASLEKPETLAQTFDTPADIRVLDGFRALTPEQLEQTLKELRLAMDLADLSFLQSYFRSEGRDPSVTEIRVADTYWSDHCRHTTFSTVLDDVSVEDPRVEKTFREYLDARREVYGDRAETRPVTLMDIATAGVKLLRKRGLLPLLDESEEINACSVKATIQVDGRDEQWLLMFKNETHNHPTEIEPFGGAATCIGGAIRDPLSGRSYVYQAMRVTGAGDPRVPLSESLPGKLSQRKLVRTAAAGYSSYGNQIGLATGLVDEIYHPGYIAKRLEIGAVVGAAPEKNVVRVRPEDGDVVILLGGRTGRDGIGGATGSSKTHNMESLTTMASEVQKGNAPEERKLQRLFRKPEVTRLIKRCNDFGAGGVSVAIGELADGLVIDLDKVPKKYEGLDGTELSISESQERMAVVVAAADRDRFLQEAAKENLEATPVAVVTAEPRMKMLWRGKPIVDLSREFLNSNGASRSAAVRVPDLSAAGPAPAVRGLRALAGDLSFCSRRGLTERFDGSIGAGSVLMPFGGKRQLTPAQCMAALFPVLEGETDDCSVMSYGFDVARMERDPYAGAACAVIESLAKLCATGCDTTKAYLTFQEYFERMGTEPSRWGKPFSALLGAFAAQKHLGVAAIGGKDSMSGTFMDLDVPPTLVSFAIAQHKAGKVLSPEFKGAGHKVYLLTAPAAFDDFEGLKALFAKFHALCEQGRVLSAWACERGGAAGGVMKMAFGNAVGFREKPGALEDWYSVPCGSILFEAAGDCDALLLGETTADGVIALGGESAPLDELCSLWEGGLERVFPTRADAAGEAPAVSYSQRSAQKPRTRLARPRVVIPVFPGTSCEYDSARAREMAGAEAEIVVVRNLNSAALKESADALEAAIRRSQMIFLPGGFSGGDEPEGSGKFIASFFRNPGIADAVTELLQQRDGLMLGICNGFQALIKLGLVPFGEIRPMDSHCPTLTFNLIGRHQSRYVTTRVSSVKSPWLSQCRLGEEHAIAVSHGEGRFVAEEETLRRLAENGQIAFQYVDEAGKPSMEITANPNGSLWAIEGITSPDGRVLGKMGHTERAGAHIAKNIPGNKLQPLFRGGVAYFG